jgi:preprotein translocase SecE subunit
MARASDGATGPAFGKPVRTPSDGLSSRGGSGEGIQSGSPARPQAARPVTKPARPAVRRAPRVVSTAVQFFKDVRAEMNRVAWPDRETVIASSLVVVFVLVVTSLYLAGWDFILAKIFQRFLR